MEAASEAAAARAHRSASQAAQEICSEMVGRVEALLGEGGGSGGEPFCFSSSSHAFRPSLADANNVRNAS